MLLGIVLLAGGLVQLVTFSVAGWPSTRAGAVVLLLGGAVLLLTDGLRRWSARRRAAADPSSARGGDVATAPDRQDVVTAQEVLEQVRVEVLPGFTPRAEVAERVSEYFEGYAGPLGPADVEAQVEAVWSQRLAEESSWTGSGDYAKVQAAFDELTSQGFVARMDFACCQTCGHAEIDDERRGGEHSYVFFHAQDTEHLAEDDSTLYLAFGCFDAHPALEPDLPRDAGAGDGDGRRALVAAARAAAVTQAGSEITDSLRRQGLAVAWDRTSASRPAVQINAWRKPLPVHGDEGPVPTSDPAP